MKKILILVLVLSSFATLSAISQTTELEKGFVSVNSSVIKEVSPNQAEISFSVETSDKSLKNAAEANKQIANKVYSNLKSLIGMSDYLKTGQYSAKPEYSYTKDNKRVLEKYVVTNTVILKTKSIDLVPKFIDTAISQGANGVNNLVFLASDYESVCNDNLAELTKKAYSQANSIAKSINSQIVGVKSINASCTTNNAPRPYFAAMSSRGVADELSVTPIESGKININLNIDASFYVK